MGFVYISKEAPASRDEMQVAAYLLNRNIIYPTNITHGINATCRLPTGYLEDALESV